MNRAFALLLLCVPLAACTFGYGDKLDPRLVHSMRLTRIDVAVAPDAKFWWGDGERAYAASLGGTVEDPEVLGRTPEGRAFMSALASERIKAAFDRALAGRLSGERPVRIEVTMQEIYISSPAQRILIGGNYSMRAAVNLVDARTGQVIATNGNISSSSMAGQGVLGAALDPAFGEPVDRVAKNLAESYRGWLQLD